MPLSRRHLPLLSCLLLGLTLLLLSPRAAGADLAWKNVGPGGGGWIQALAADPRDPETLYLGCDVGGFYRSHDGGRTWTIRNTGLTDYFVESIAVHPRDSRILLLGMEGGVFRSEDGGDTWKAMRDGFPAPEPYSFSAPIGALAFDPAHPEIVYAGIGRPRHGKEGRGRIYRSADGGRTWSVCTPDGVLPADAIVSDIEVAPSGAYVLAATSRGLYRSDDTGKTWQASVSGLAHDVVQEIAVAASRPSTVYCTLRPTARDAQPHNGGVYRSDDGGRTWQRRAKGLADRVGKTGEPAQMTSNAREIVVDARDPETVYAGDSSWVTAGVYKTTDGGRSWKRMTDHNSASKNMDYGWITQWGPAVTCLTLSPAAPARLWFGTSGHVFFTGDGGATWQQRYSRANPDGTWTGNGLEVTCLNDIQIDPHRPDRAYLCYMDIGLLITDDAGRSVRAANEGMRYKGNTFTVAFDPLDRDTLWAGTGEWGNPHGDLCRSTDGGKTWKPVGTPATGLPDGQVRTILVDPASPAGNRTLWATSSGNGVYRSTDGGASWQSAVAGLTAAAIKQPRGLMMDPRDPKRLRLALAGNAASGGGIWETRDAGATWTRVSGDSPLGDIQALYTDPFAFDTLYATQRDSTDRSQTPPAPRPGGLYKSADGGRSWARVFENRFVSRVAFVPGQRGVLYLGTTDHPYHDGNRAAGVWRSDDAGKTWTRVGAGMTHDNISALRIGHGRIWAGTAGNGVFVAPLAEK